MTLMHLHRPRVKLPDDQRRAIRVWSRERGINAANYALARSIWNVSQSTLERVLRGA